MQKPKELPGLAPDRDPWERQPAETEKQYAQFQMYLEQGRKRTLAQTAEFLALNAKWVRSVAAAKLWTERAAAWDRAEDQRFFQEMADERRKLVKDEAKIAGAFLSKIIPRLRRITDTDMDRVGPVELGKLVELTMRLMRDAYGVPDKTTTASSVARDMEAAESAGSESDVLTDSEKIAQLKSWNQEIADFLDFAQEAQQVTESRTDD